MTVAELIEKLKKVKDPDLLVVCPGVGDAILPATGLSIKRLRQSAPARYFDYYISCGKTEEAEVVAIGLTANGLEDI